MKQMAGTTRAPKRNWKLLLCFICGYLASNIKEVTWMLRSGQQREAVETKTSLSPAAPSNGVERELTHARENPKSAFDAITETAYKRAIVEKRAEETSSRIDFDIEYWEEESNLTTKGGLRTEDRILLGDLYRKAKSVFEYGLGESTYIANHVGVPRYAGIDSDPVWVGMARDKVAHHFRFYLADIGETGAWGKPTERGLPKNVLDYQLAPLIVEPKPFDVYMVDGRWRLPCMLASFLHASARGAHPNETTVLLHDCSADADSATRLNYKKADDFLQLVRHSGGRLCVYKRYPNTTDDQLQDAWHRFVDIVG